MLRSIAASKGQLVRKQGELGSPKHESIVSLAETRGFYRQTQPAKCRPCRQESSLILGQCVVFRLESPLLRAFYFIQYGGNSSCRTIGNNICPDAHQ